jgi:hypothetical protein
MNKCGLIDPIADYVRILPATTISYQGALPDFFRGLIFKPYTIFSHFKPIPGKGFHSKRCRILSWSTAKLCHFGRPGEPGGPAENSFSMLILGRPG